MESNVTRKHSRARAQRVAASGPPGGLAGYPTETVRGGHLSTPATSTARSEVSATLVGMDGADAQATAESNQAIRQAHARSRFTVEAREAGAGGDGANPPSDGGSGGPNDRTDAEVGGPTRWNNRADADFGGGVRRAITPETDMNMLIRAPSAPRGEPVTIAIDRSRPMPPAHHLLGRQKPYVTHSPPGSKPAPPPPGQPGRGHARTGTPPRPSPWTSRRSPTPSKQAKRIRASRTRLSTTG